MVDDLISAYKGYSFLAKQLVEINSNAIDKPSQIDELRSVFVNLEIVNG